MRKRVLVARLDSLGDVLLAGPAVRAVAEEADVVMLCGPRGAPAAAMLPGVSELIVWDAPWVSPTSAAVSEELIVRLCNKVQRAAVTDAIILTSFHQSPLPLAILLRLAGVERISGASIDYPGSLLDVRLIPGEDFSEDIPEPERALLIVAAAGYHCHGDGRLRVLPAPDTRKFTGPGPYVVIHPGASVPARTCPVGLLARTAAVLNAMGKKIVVTGSGEERFLAREISASAPGTIDLTGACSLPELAGVLAGATAVICGNTGPAHLAAAVGTPIVSLFSPVVPAIRWAPYGVPVRLLGDQDASCKNTRARECPVPGHPCLSAVTPDELVTALLDLEIETAQARGWSAADGSVDLASAHSSREGNVTA